MRISDIDIIIKEATPLSGSEINQLFEFIKSEPLKFIFSGRYWLYFAILSLIPFVVVVKLPNTIIANFSPAIDPIVLKIVSLLFFFNKFSIHFLIKILMVNRALTGLYYVSNRPVTRYRTVRIALFFFIVIALVMRFI